MSGCGGDAPEEYTCMQYISYVIVIKKKKCYEMSFTYRWMFMNKEEVEETEKQQNQESNPPKRYKVNKIKKLEEEMEQFVSCCRFVIILMGVKGFGALISSISKKCDLEKQIKNLKKHINFDEYNIDEQFEEQMKRR